MPLDDVAVAEVNRVTGHFAGQQWVAAAILAVAFPLIFVLYSLAARLPVLQPRSARRVAMRSSTTGATLDTSPVFAAGQPATLTGRSSAVWTVLVGADGRLSTSKTIALLWTIVVAYCVLAVTLVATARVGAPSGVLAPDTIPPGFMSPGLHHLWPEYLILLGGPFASAIAAKSIVTGKISNGTLQKSQKQTPASALDVISDDDGSLDLVDLQYTVFNLIAAIYVITQFIPHAGHGIPVVPPEFAWLTGASAATYTANKAAVSNPPAITAVTPVSDASPDTRVAIRGRNLAVGAQPSRSDVQVLLAPQVINGSAPERADAAADAVQITPDRVTPVEVVFTVPAHTRAGAKSLAVVTNGQGLAIMPPGVTFNVAPAREEVTGGGQAKADGPPS